MNSTIQSSPAINVTITPPSQALSIGGTINLTANASGGVGSFTYSWTGPNGFTAATQSIMIQNVGAVNAGTYTVTVTDSLRCTGTQSAEITVNGQRNALSAAIHAKYCSSN